jgi:hypothetical protein
MTTEEECAARFDVTKHLFTEEEIQESLAEHRRFVGSASGMYRPGRRLWNWVFDAEYTAVGPAPIWWFIVVGGLLAVIALAALGVLW